MTKLPLYFYFFFFFLFLFFFLLPFPLPTSSNPTNLRGPLKVLSPLDQLRLLNLHNNRLNGTISPPANYTNLKLLYLAENDFSGEISLEIFSVKGLLRIDLSDNNIRGDIPYGFSRLRSLLTLRLNNNMLSGKIPDLSSLLSNLKELNLTNIKLYGRLADGMLKKFGEISFSGNEGLCGSTPFPPCSFTEIPSPVGSDQTVSSNPSSLPKTPIVAEIPKKQTRKGLSPGAIVAIVIANCVKERRKEKGKRKKKKIK